MSRYPIRIRIEPQEQQYLAGLPVAEFLEHAVAEFARPGAEYRQDQADILENMEPVYNRVQWEIQSGTLHVSDEDYEYALVTLFQRSPAWNTEPAWTEQEIHGAGHSDYHAMRNKLRVHLGRSELAATRYRTHST